MEQRSVKGTIGNDRLSEPLWRGVLHQGGENGLWTWRAAVALGSPAADHHPSRAVHALTRVGAENETAVLKGAAVLFMATKRNPCTRGRLAHGNPHKDEKGVFHGPLLKGHQIAR